MRAAILRAYGEPLTIEDSSDQIHGFAFMCAAIPAAGGAISEIAGLVREPLARH